LDSKGGLLTNNQADKLIPVEKVTTIENTAAGDVFNGAIAVALSRGLQSEEAVIFANKAASISVTRMGAQLSAPYKNEIE